MPPNTTSAPAARAAAPAARFEIASWVDAELPPCAAVTAIGEVVNYGFDPRGGDAALHALFARVHAAVAPGGVFVLDVAGPGRVPGGGPRPGPGRRSR